MDKKTPEEKGKPEEPEFTLEPIQEESKTEETGFTLEPDKEETIQDEPSFSPEPSEEKPQPAEPQLDLEPPKGEASLTEPQLDLEPPKEDTPQAEPQLDLEPPKEKAPQPDPVKTEKKPVAEILVDTEIEPLQIPKDEKKDNTPDDKKGTRHEKGVSTRFDPRRTKVTEGNEEKFEPQISFAKGTAQDGSKPSSSASAFKNPKIIGSAATAIIIIAAVLFFMFKPESAPIESPKKLAKKITAVNKKPAQKKKSPAAAEKKEEKAAAPQHEKYSNNSFSINLPKGYETATDSSPKVQKIYFLYGKYIKVQILSWKQQGGWNPEENMYDKIEEVQKVKNNSNALRVNNYGLVKIDGCKGYEIIMSGIRNYTFSKAKFYSFHGKGKMFLIDIDCKNPKDPGVQKTFGAINDSIAKTLKIK